VAAASGSALALAARLRALDDDALERLIRDRGVRQAGVRDYFDLAEALLDRGSIQLALQRLDRPTIAVIAVAGELATAGPAPTAAGILAVLDGVGAPSTDAEPLEEEAVRERAGRAALAGLLDEDGDRYRPWDAVADVLRSWPAAGLPDASALVAEPPPPALQPVSEADARFVDRGATERAFATLDALGEVLLALRDAPARRLSRGGLALPDARRLAAAAGVPPEEAELLLDAAVRADLAALEPRAWQAADGVDAWLALPRADRWERLARGWLDRVPPDLRVLLEHHAHSVWGDGLLAYLAWLYPAGGQWIEGQVRQAVREAELLGIVCAATPSAPGAALLTAGPEAARDALARLLPPEVDRVYVQHDLTIIAPGPLAPAADVALRRVADAESRGMAPSFRVTAASLTRALVDGMTADDIRESLAALSLTGIPQPVEYLIADTAARFGTLRVGPVVPERSAARSYLRSADSGLLGQLLVDPNVQSLALVCDAEQPERLLSRFAPDIVFWTLHDARYPVVAEDASGAMLSLRRAAVPGGDHLVSDDTAAIVLARVRTASPESAEGADDWLLRQLELAVKGRTAVNVRVRMPDGAEVDYLLEPAALASGRLRARDRRADIERTLPLSSIVAVDPA